LGKSNGSIYWRPRQPEVPKIMFGTRRIQITDGRLGKLSRLTARMSRYLSVC